MLTDPSYLPWRDEAVRRGYASAIALPLIYDGRTFGVLTLYSAETDTFTEEEVKLLSDMAHECAYGIAALRLRLENARVQAERERLLEQMKTFVHLVSHDLRAPLTIINGHTGLLQDYLAGSEQAPALKSAEAIARGVKRMDTMIDDFSHDRAAGGRATTAAAPADHARRLPAVFPHAQCRCAAPGAHSPRYPRRVGEHHGG